MSELAVDTFGTGIPVVLVHGSLATGVEEWDAQRPLAEAGFRLLVPDRRGYGQSPPADGEDYLRDGDDIAELLGDGAHLVGHSYGCLGAMVAAASRPEATLTLALLEPPVPAAGDRYAAADEMIDGLRQLWQTDLPDEEWLISFLGADPHTLPAEMVQGALPLVPLLRNGRTPWEADLPLGPLASATFPKLVVSGGHSKAFDEMCDSVAERIGAGRAVVEGAGHEIQFTGPPINEALLALWRSASEPGT